MFKFLEDSIFKNVLSFDWNEILTGELLMSLVVIFVLLVICLIIFIQCKKTPVMQTSKGLLSLAEMAFDKIDSISLELMGPAFKNSIAEAFIVTCFMYIPFCFLFGVMGLPCAVSSLTITLSLALISFLLIHITSIKYTKMAYFKRYIDPMPLFLPINLVSMWSPLLSLSLRLFGNGLSGYVLMTLIYGALQNLGSWMFSGLGQWGSIFFAPILTPILHAYFDLFSGAIQTVVFTFISMLFIAIEKPEEEVPTQTVRTPNTERKINLKEA